MKKRGENVSFFPPKPVFLIYLCANQASCFSLAVAYSQGLAERGSGKTLRVNRSQLGQVGGLFAQLHQLVLNVVVKVTQLQRAVKGDSEGKELASISMLRWCEQNTKERYDEIAQQGQPSPRELLRWRISRISKPKTNSSTDRYCNKTCPRSPPPLLLKQDARRFSPPSVMSYSYMVAFSI